MKENWVEIRKSGNYVELGEKLGVSPIVARIIRNRGIDSPEEMQKYIDATSVEFHPGSELYGMNILVKVMVEKINAKAPVRIIGDYDVDGVCATYILYRGLSYLGADVDYAIPHRVEDGYGINIRLIDDAHEKGVDTIITCDNGISASKQTEYANSLGMTMVITDHHEVPYETVDGEKRHILPNADAIVDPKQPRDSYPYKGICGAFVALKVFDELAKALGKSDAQDYADLYSELTEFAALATICDVMELKDENRTLVRQGLKLMRHSKNRGLRALIEACKIQDRMLSPYHAGFIIGPALNATGRLDSSIRAMQLFCSDSDETAVRLAMELKSLNDIRKQMTIEETEKAINMVLEQEVPDKVLCLVLDECHESLAGIIAGRVRERFCRPTFVLTRTEQGLKGSGRSIDAYDMFEGLMGVSEELSKFGGHKLAAGLSLEESHFEEFKRKINENCTLTDEDFVETIRIDMQLPFGYATLALAHDLEKLDPVGNGNETPVFACLDVTVLTGKIFGANKNVAKYKVSDGDGKVYELISFGGFDELENFVGEIYGEEKKRLLHSGLSVNIKLDICYKISINTYMGQESVQLLLKSYR